MASEDEETLLYSYSHHYHVPEKASKGGLGKEKVERDLSDSPKVQCLNMIVHRLPGNCQFANFYFCSI
jgi:hypothetical protein